MSKKTDTPPSSLKTVDSEIGKSNSQRTSSPEDAAQTGRAATSKLDGDSRSDQEQEGLQNPAGDTREVSREPLDDVDPSTKTSR